MIINHSKKKLGSTKYLERVDVKNKHHKNMLSQIDKKNKII